MKKLALFPLVAMMLIGCECNESHPDAALIEESAKVGCTDFRVMTMITELRTQNGRSMQTKTMKVCVLSEKPYSVQMNHEVPMDEVSMDEEPIVTPILPNTEKPLNGPIFGE